MSGQNIRTIRKDKVHVGIKRKQLTRHLTTVIERDPQTVVDEVHHAATLNLYRWLIMSDAPHYIPLC